MMDKSDELLLIADSNSKIIPDHVCTVQIGSTTIRYESFALVGFKEVKNDLPNIRTLAACQPGELVLGAAALLNDTIKMIKAMPDVGDRKDLKMVVRELVEKCLEML